LPSVERRAPRNERAFASAFAEQQRRAFDRVGSLLAERVSVLGAQRQHPALDQKAL
jgi:hypothetical protein